MDAEDASGSVIRTLLIGAAGGAGGALASQLGAEERDDFDVRTVATLEEARTVLAGERVDCVVAHHDPPSVDGVELLAALREDHAELPILLATETAHADRVLDSAATGIVEMADGEAHGGLVANRIESVVAQVRERRAYETRLQASQESLERLHRITANPELTFEEQLQRLLAFGSEVFGLEVAFLARIDEESADFEVVSARGDHDLIQAGSTTDLSRTYCRRTIDADTASPLAVQDAPKEMVGDPAFEKFGLGCYMGVRIDVDGELYGTLCFADVDPRQSEFSDEERILVEIMAQWLRQRLEQREYRRELESTRDRLERTLRRVDDAFFAVDTDWRVTYVNDVGADVLRRAMGLGDDADVVDRHLWENVPEAVETTFYEEYHAAMETQESVSFVEYFDPMDVWFEVRAYPDEAGLSVYFTDVTDRKERERELDRLQYLLNQTERVAEVGGWEVDVETMGVFWTENLYDMLGVASDEEPGLDEALDVYLPEDRVVVERAIEEAVETGESFDVELRYRRSGEEIRWLHVQGVPITDEAGDVVAIRGAAQDVTDRRHREQTLNALLSASRAFIEAATREELLTAIIDEVGRVFDHDIASVRLHDERTGTLPPTRYSSPASEHVPEPPVFDDDEGVVGEAFRSGEPIVVDDMDAATGVDYGAVESGMFLPLGEHGVLGIGSRRASAFEAGDAALVELLAVAAASAFDRLERATEARRLRRTLDHLNEKVFLVDEGGELTVATRPFAEYLDRDPDDLVGTSLTDLVPPGAVDSFETVLRELRSASSERRLTVESEVRVGEDVRPVEFEFSATAGTRTGAAIAGVLHDISELAETRSHLEAERERFQELFENLPDPVVEVKFDGEAPIVEYSNPAFSDVFGVDRTAARGENLHALVVPDDRAPDPGILHRSTQTDRQVRVDVQRETADGRRDFLVRSIPFSLGGDQFAFAVYTDITDQKERERYLQVLNRVLRHNLRNDMNVVMGLARRLGELVDGEEATELAETLRSNAEDVATLSEKAREIERVLGGDQRDDRAVDVVSLLRTAITETRSDRPDAAITLDVPDELWTAGSEKLSRAFRELIENAIEHTDAEDPRVAVGVRTDPSADGWVEVRIQDNGTGISDGEWRVVSGEEDISQLSHGSGLGLWLTRWIVESHGGEIRRERTSADGGTVVVRLPRAEPPGRETDGS